MSFFSEAIWGVPPKAEARSFPSRGIDAILSSVANGISPRVRSSQTNPSPRLLERVQKHACSEWQRPLAWHGEQAWERLCSWRLPTRPLILDLGCGRGDAARELAALFPESQVLGIDKSAFRLRDAGEATERLLLMRADIEDLIPLMKRAGWRAERVYVLYPNPWPKPRQAKRRWPHHPVFPLLLALGPVEMRTNWEVYAQEWALAAESLGYGVQGPHRLDGPGRPTSAFEKKYLASGHLLWRVVSHG